MRTKLCQVLPLAGLILGLAVPAHAATGTLVNVDLRNARILNNIANDLNVNISNIPITVQVPVSIAANVCKVTVAVLANSFDRGSSTCSAQSTSFALEKQVQRVINLNQ